uniref:Uncharacterized protein n=1 Tax=Romanomermis culicivorax TaxID=13658 RepID=A0A915KFQ0_ROMCU
MVNSGRDSRNSTNEEETVKPESSDDNSKFVHNCNEIETVLSTLLKEVHRIKNRAEKFNVKFRSMKTTCQSLDKTNSILEAELKLAEKETRHLRNENDLLKKKLQILLDRSK